MSLAEDIDRHAGDVAAVMLDIGRRARAASAALALAPSSAKDAALRAAAVAIRAEADLILAANAEDVVAARAKGQRESLVDRLVLDPKRLDGIAAGLEAIA